ncbi:MAG: hypothetical protein Q7R92_02445 [bacterium]|nr:hypothetical protein [bacterium]
METSETKQKTERYFQCLYNVDEGALRMVGDPVPLRFTFYIKRGQVVLFGPRESLAKVKSVSEIEALGLYRS